MIVTVTLNAALDVTYRLDRLRPGGTNRVASVTERAGGKGVNVARVLSARGRQVRVAGLAGGASGEMLRADLDRAALPHLLTPVGGSTRRTVAVIAVVATLPRTCSSSASTSVVVPERVSASTRS